MFPERTRTISVCRKTDAGIFNPILPDNRPIQKRLSVGSKVYRY